MRTLDVYDKCSLALGFSIFLVGAAYFIFRPYERYEVYCERSSSISCKLTQTSSGSTESVVLSIDEGTQAFLHQDDTNSSVANLCLFSRGESVCGLMIFRRGVESREAIKAVDALNNFLSSRSSYPVKIETHYPSRFRMLLLMLLMLLVLPIDLKRKGYFDKDE